VASDTLVEQYLKQLQETLPRVQPVSVRELEALHKDKDYEGIVRIVRRALNLEANLVVGWVNSGGPKDKPDAPAWVEMPADMPFHGTEAFRKLKLKVCFRKSFLEESDYDQVAVAVAHELSHIVLDSIHHPLRQEEKAVDLTAMLLGFRILYTSACYKERRSGNTITFRTLGYLSKREVEQANEILARDHRRSEIKEIPNLIARHKYPLLAIGAIMLIAVIVGTMPIPGQKLHQALLAEQADIQRQIPKR
jgi:hypothetical protein